MTEREALKECVDALNILCPNGVGRGSYALHHARAALAEAAQREQGEFARTVEAIARANHWPLPGAGKMCPIHTFMPLPCETCSKDKRI